MAGGIIVSSHGKDYPGELTFKVLMTCIVAAMGGLIFGYDLGISGNIPFFFIYHYLLFIFFVSGYLGY
jgi:hypothetical protein